MYLLLDMVLVLRDNLSAFFFGLHCWVVFNFVFIFVIWADIVNVVCSIEAWSDQSNVFSCDSEVWCSFIFCHSGLVGASDCCSLAIILFKYFYVWSSHQVLEFVIHANWNCLLTWAAIKEISQSCYGNCSHSSVCLCSEPRWFCFNGVGV